MPAESQAKVISWKTKWRGVRVLLHGDALGEREKLERRAKARPLGKGTCGCSSCWGKGHEGLRCRSLLVRSSLPWALSAPAGHPPAPTTSWQSRRACLRLDLAGLAHTVCAILVEKGKIETPELYAEAFASVRMQGESGGQVMNVLIKMLVMMTVPLTYFFKKLVYRWAMWLVPYW